MSQLSGTISPYLTGAAIQGNLNIGNQGANLFQGAGDIVNNPQGAIGAFANNYAGAYNSALAANQQNYANVLKGYQGTMGAQNTAQQAISGGYNQLYNTVLGTLGVGQGGAVGAGGTVNQGGNWGVAAPAAQAIADTYAQQQGSVLENAVNTGIGGTSALTSLERGPSLDAAKAYGALGANLAQTAAGYESSLGQAGLNYANQAAMQNTALSNQQLQFMQGVQIPYPSASAFGSMISGAAGMQAATLAASRARAAQGGAAASIGPHTTGNAGITRPFPNSYPSGGGGGGGTPSVRVTGTGIVGSKGMAPAGMVNTQAAIDAGLGMGANTVGAGTAGINLANLYESQASQLADNTNLTQSQLDQTTGQPGSSVDNNGDIYDQNGNWIGNVQDYGVDFAGGGGGSAGGE